ncbi:MAG TPA: alpha/beta hydrolase [Terriglobales bacterium]|jgi:acetyl esterase/lipase|nr:alpha/beta hydrolase [Terriglobales bacterium]
MTKLFVVCLLLATTALAQVRHDETAPTQTILLWQNGAPGAQGQTDDDQPSITVYKPWEGKNPGTSVVVAPGGGYGFLASNHEGRQVANWFNSLGVTAFVLKYRLGPKYHHPIELGDAQRAIRLVRSRAKEFGILPDRVGMMGFSAGGHLASTVETHFDSGNPNAADPIDRESSRPDFAILAYPVITLYPPYAHRGSLKNLLGENPDPKLVENLSNERQVTAQTPPTFLFSTSEDTAVPPENSLNFYAALHKAGVPAELHIFEKGEHGVGLDLGDPSLGEWPVLLAHWLRSRGLLTAPN